MVQARLERMETEARRVLRAASVYGQVFWEGGVRALLGGAERTAQVSEWLRELSAREVISQRPDSKFPGEPEYAFRHGLVREAAYAMLTEADRALGHRLAGEWLEKAGEQEAVVLAEHMERGGDSARAVGWYQKAASQALGGNDLSAAIARAERGLAALGAATGPGVDEKMGELRLIQAEAHRWRAEFPAAERVALDAMAKVRRGTSAWFEAAEMLAFSSGSLGHHEILLDLFDNVTKLDAELISPSAPMIAVKQRLAIQLLHAGRTELCDRLLAWLDEVSPPFEADDPAIAGRVNALRALRVFFGGNPGEYLSQSQRSVESFERAGDMRNAMQHRGSMGYAALEIGLYDDAIKMLREVRVGAERMGLWNIVGTALQNLGLALGCAGRFEEARHVEAQAVKSFLVSGNRRMHAASLYYLAWIRSMANDLRHAEEECRQAVEIASAAPAILTVRAEGLGILATILLAKKRPAEALVAAADAFGILEEMGGIDGGEFLIRLVYAEALDANGRHEEAVVRIRDTTERLHKLSVKMTDPAIRNSFLENVQVNARILQLAGKWQ
jgi:tetratricopeptide (TPR) repeat protein